MLSFAEAAERLVADGIAQSMTAEGLRKLARDPASGWPIGPDDYRVVGKTRMLPYEPLVPYIQGRRRGRGPAKQPRTERGKNMPSGKPLDGADAHAVLRIVWQWIADANDGAGGDAGHLQRELEAAGYGPPQSPTARPAALPPEPLQEEGVRRVGAQPHHSGTVDPETLPMADGCEYWRKTNRGDEVCPMSSCARCQYLKRL